MCTQSWLINPSLIVKNYIGQACLGSNKLLITLRQIMIFLRVLKFMRIQSKCLNNAMGEFDVIFVTGYWGHIPARQALATVDTELHGQNIQWYFHMWDVAQVDSVRLSQILHWCLVLARFCHCRCEYAQKSKIFVSLWRYISV